MRHGFEFGAVHRGFGFGFGAVASGSVPWQGTGSGSVRLVRAEVNRRDTESARHGRMQARRGCRHGQRGTSGVVSFAGRGRITSAFRHSGRTTRDPATADGECFVM